MNSRMILTAHRNLSLSDYDTERALRALVLKEVKSRIPKEQKLSSDTWLNVKYKEGRNEIIREVNNILTKMEEE